jgi:hypothetical protein
MEEGGEEVPRRRKEGEDLAQVRGRKMLPGPAANRRWPDLGQRLMVEGDDQMEVVMTAPVQLDLGRVDMVLAVALLE